MFLSSPGSHTILRARSIHGRPTIYAGVNSQLGLRDDAKLAALFNNPGSVALNRANGSLYVADRNNHVIRRIPLEDEGEVETIAGDGQSGARDGIGASARFNSPTGVALDVSGGLWVADSGNHTIRRINLQTGMVETIAGLAGQPGSADGVGPAARFNSPSGIAVRREPLALQLQREKRGEAPPLTTVIVADTGNDDLRLLTSDGRTDTVIVRRREPLQSQGGDNGSFDEPRGVASDFSGNIFVSEGAGQVMTVLPDGTVVPAAQEGTFEEPGDLTITESGRIIVTDAEVTGRELVYGAPDITHIEPDQVGMAGGQEVTLTGRNFAQDSIVVLAGRILKDARVVDTSTILFRVPAFNSGLKTVTVQNRGGLDQIALDVPPPALQDLQPGDITTVVGGGDFTGDGLIATEANLSTPFHLAIDSKGDLFIADSPNHRVRRVDIEGGIITSVAGTGENGRVENGSLAIASPLSNPEVLRFDSAGNMLIADVGSGRILRVDAETRVVSTIAGTFRGFGGDGGPATEAQLFIANAFDLNSRGDLAIGDSGNFRIRQVDAKTGIISTLAGDGTEGCARDGDPLLETQFITPWAIGFDPDDNLFISDSLCGNILRIDAGSDVVSVFATNLQPIGLDFDSQGRLVVVDRSIIRRFDRTTGEQERIAGDGFDDFAGDGGPALDASFRFPRGLVIDAADNIFVSDTENFRIRKINAETGTVTTVAGREGTLGDGGRAPNAVLEHPVDVQFDNSGNLFISDHLDFRIRRVDVNQQITTVPSTQGMEVARMTLDPQGNLTVSRGRWDIHRVDLQTGEWSTIYGGGPTNCFTEDGEIAFGASLAYLGGVAYDRDGNLYFGAIPSPNQPCELPGGTVITDRHSRVRRIDAVTGRLSTVVGTGVVGFEGDGGPATQARINDPVEIVFDSLGNLLILDAGNARVRRVDAGSGIITTIAGGGSESISDGLPATDVSFTGLRGMAIDRDEAIYLSLRPLILRVDPETHQIFVVAGNGRIGVEGDGGSALEADLDFPFGIIFDGSRNLFVIDDQRVRAIKGPIP